MAPMGPNNNQQVIMRGDLVVFCKPGDCELLKHYGIHHGAAQELTSRCANVLAKSSRAQLEESVLNLAVAQHLRNCPGPSVDWECCLREPPVRSSYRV